jgi:putative ABC transport system substrate-binding protein
VTLGRGMYGCVLLSLVTLIILVCWIPTPPAYAGQIRVAVVESRQIKAYDLALDGFTEALVKRGYAASMVRYVVGEDVNTPEDFKAKVEETGADVVLALGTSAARLVKDAGTSIPSVFSMVSEPAQSGLLNSDSADGTPMTGVCLDVPVENQFKSLLDVVPRARKIGVIYNPEESQFMVDEARHAANRMGLGLVTYEVHSEAEVHEGLNSLRPRIDALWLVSDRTVLTTTSLQYVFLFAFQTNLPLMGVSEHFVRMGALVAVGPDYYDVGSQSGEFAAQILGGRNPEELPVASPRKVQLSLNLRTAEIIGLRIPEVVVRKATSVY